MEASFDAEGVFGSQAGEVAAAVRSASAGAHEGGVRAQVGSGSLKRQDPYGHTVKVRQFEQLVEVVGALPGAETRPVRGAIVPLVQVQGCLLYPWRYATDATVSRRDAKMTVSQFRLALLEQPADDPQLSLDQAGLSDEELAAQQEADHELERHLWGLQPVLVVAYASGFGSGLVSVGWGEATLAGATGVVEWASWSSLDAPSLAASGGARGSLRSVHDDVPTVGRFAQPGAGSVDLKLRQPGEQPAQEAPAEADSSGTEDDRQ